METRAFSAHQRGLFAATQVSTFLFEKSNKIRSSLMPRLHLAVLTTRNEAWRLWKQLSKF